MRFSRYRLVAALKEWVQHCPPGDRFPLALCLAQCLRELLSDAVPPVGEEQLAFFAHCVGCCWRLADDLKATTGEDAATPLSEWEWMQSLQGMEPVTLCDDPTVPEDVDPDTGPESPLSTSDVPVPDEDAPVGLAVLVHGAHGVPKVDRLGHADAFVELWVERHGLRTTGVQRTDVCWGVANPVWKAFLEFGGEPTDKDVLHVKLKNFNIHRETTIGVGYTPVLALLEGDPTELDVMGERASRRSCTVTLQRVPLLAPPCTKTLFILRHGQSKWNAAQESHAYHQMAQYDHPINAKGLAQARTFRDAWLSSTPSRFQEAFLEADTIFCSPLTRAIQTCALALQGHPTLCHKGILLLKSAREVKKMMGMDTVGKATGDRIIDRVRDELAKLLPPEEVDMVMPRIDPYDTVAHWWKAVGSESQRTLARRLESFLATVKYIPGDSVIVVGHSLFFLELLRRYLSPDFRSRFPDWSRDLTTLKLNNVACLGLTVDFGPRTPQITAAALMFGTTLHPPKPKRMLSSPLDFLPH